MPRKSENDKPPSSMGGQNVVPILMEGEPAEIFLCYQARRMWRNLPGDRRDEAIRVLSTCGSPIEQVLLLALLDHCLDGETPVYLMRGDDPDTWDAIFTGDPRINIISQWKSGPYRLDFLVHAYSKRKNIFVAVECDGHDFHERTAEQAARDKERDVYLQLQGLRVARFTGTAIVRNPWACAATAVRLTRHFL